MKHPKYSHSFEVVSHLPAPLAPLSELAANFRWTWRHETRQLFREIDKATWDESGHNPNQFLRMLSRERLQKLASDQGFLDRLAKESNELAEYLKQETWFDREYPGRREDTQIAYFCAEFGVSEGLPIYSGGLGVLAGDHLKAASDLGIPLVAVGLLYSRGYFRQYLSPEGWQQEHYPTYDFYEMPISLVRNGDGNPLRISVEFPDRVVTCQVWRAEVGRIPLYLLDSNVLDNEAADQGITDTLYGGDEEMRIRQEMILGMGGMRALQALGLSPTVCHMNEGHAAFLSIERIRQFMESHKTDFRTARQAIINGNVFTTHTPVPAGFDLFPIPLVERYLKTTAEKVGLPFADFVKLGRFNIDDSGEAFNMALLAMDNANYINGVSKLHAEVSRGLFQARWSDLPEDEVPIDDVTNGIHTMTWVSWRMSELFHEYLGEAWRRDPSDPEVWKGIWEIPDEELWNVREKQRLDLVRFSRKHLLKSFERRGSSREVLDQIESILEPRALTIGFARRFATYKRATLMLQDKEWLKRIMFHPERPVQFVISGKSHPRDDGGKKLIQDLVNFINNEGARTRMIFLEDYDMRVARALVQGVDVWLNNPRRPLEASGTSGMKALPNGVLNCSILDGWWDEAYEPGVGWAIGDRFGVADQVHQDWLDSRTLYHLIESEIAPLFYHRQAGGAPTGWIDMVKRSIAKLSPQFSTARMVSDYTRKFYVPASEAFTKVSGDELKEAKAALLFKDRVNAAWPGVKVVASHDDGASVCEIGQEFTITAEIELGSLTAGEVRVEAIVGKVSTNRDLVQTTTVELQPREGSDRITKFTGKVVCTAVGLRGYTVRVTPRHASVNSIQELPLVRWQ